MFSFANPEYLYLLLLLPAVAAMHFWARRDRRRKLARFGRAEVVPALMPDVSPYKSWIKLILELLLIALAVIILARPRAGAGKSVTKVHGIEVMVAVDVSNSMNASSTDNPQDISRLQRAKLIVEKLIDRFDNDKVGLIVFAGNAYMQMPITSDVSSAKLFLNNISTNMVPTQGTAIGAAIDLAAQSFSQSKKSQKAIIVITDGENFEDDAKDAAAKANKAGIQVDVMGVGSAKGAPIPMAGEGYLTDDQGQTVVTSLNEGMAKDIAKAGHGAYVSGNAADAVETLYDTLDTLAKTDLATETYTRQNEQFPVFAWIALVLLVILTALMERKNPWLEKFNFFTKKDSQDAQDKK
ncbi:MAG: VWA domain-containing protein [Bacteroidales bacterium]|nr:VWA domain-containing protein [Candidatus Sodaliphilus aphodohippi]